MGHCNIPEMLMCLDCASFCITILESTVFQNCLFCRLFLPLNFFSPPNSSQISFSPYILSYFMPKVKLKGPFISEEAHDFLCFEPARHILYFGCYSGTEELYLIPQFLFLDAYLDSTVFTQIKAFLSTKKSAVIKMTVTCLMLPGHT